MSGKLLKTVLCAAALTALVGGACVRTVTDDNGDQVEVPERIERTVVTNILPLASTAAAFAGDATEVVGMHPASMSASTAGLLPSIAPKALKAKTGFIQGANLNVESLLALSPDVVLVNAPDRRMLERVRSAGLTAFGISPVKWNYDVVDTFDGWISALAELWPERSERADWLKGEMHRVAGLVEERVKDIPEAERLSVLFVVRSDPRQIVVSGKRFFGESWAARAGARNAASGITAENANAAVSMESIYAWNPDVVILTNFTPLAPSDLAAGRDDNRDWSHVKAVQEGRVYKMPLGIYRTFTPAGDAPMTLLWLAKTLYPERFSDIDLEREMSRYYEKGFGARLSRETIAGSLAPSAAGAKNASTNVRSGR